MAAAVAVTPTDLLRRTVSGRDLEMFGVFADPRTGAGMPVALAVTLANQFRWTPHLTVIQVFLFPAAFRLFMATHSAPPFLYTVVSSYGANSPSISFRHAARVSARSR